MRRKVRNKEEINRCLFLRVMEISRIDRKNVIKKQQFHRKKEIKSRISIHSKIFKTIFLKENIVKIVLQVDLSNLHKVMVQDKVISFVKTYKVRQLHLVV